MRYWIKTIVRTPADTFVIQMEEYEWVDGELYLSDIDEPSATAGMEFDTYEAAACVCRGFGWRLSHPLLGGASANPN